MRTLPPLQHRLLPVTAAASVLLITLFFGLKPEGYRFINQIHLRDSSLVFTNIGMIYSKRTLGKIGLADSMHIVASLKPYRTGRVLSRIISIIGKNGNDLVTIDQWKKGIELTLWDANGARMHRTGIGAALSPDSFQWVSIGITGRELLLSAGASGEPMARRSIALPSGYFADGHIVLGMAATGRSPWRGEIGALALYREATAATSIAIDNAPEQAGSFGGAVSGKQPAALFLFDTFAEQTIFDQSGNNWNFTVPRIPKIMRNEGFELLPRPHGGMLGRSFLFDMVVNLIGFFPFGFIFFLLFRLRYSGRKALLITVAGALCVSAAIETTQLFIPTRSSQLIDLVLNTIGAYTGGVLAAISLKNSAAGKR